MASRIAARLSIFVIGLGLLAGTAQGQSKGWDPTEYLKRADANGNGQMDPDEMKGRWGEYISKLGFTVSQPVPISDIINRARGEDKKRETEKRSDSSSRSTVVRKVPGFGVESETRGTVSNFSSDGSTNNPAVLDRKYGDKIMDQVRSTLDRHDRNRNGKLDADEIEGGRWGRPSPQDSDLNKDGVLSSFELAERYKNRESSNDRDDRNSRDRNSRDRDSRDRDSRDRDSRGSDRSSSSSSSSGADQRAKARAAAEKAAKERRAEEEKRSSSSSRSRNSRDQDRAAADRARAKEAAERAMAERSRSSSSNSSSSGGTTANFNKSSDRFEKYADGLIKRYDKNDDGELDKKEMQSFKRPPVGVDRNNDGVVSRSELVGALAKNSEDAARKKEEDVKEIERDRERSSRESSSRSSSRGSRSSSRSSSRDKNGDRLIQMHEFTDDWTMEKIEEFKRLDKDNDGVLSPSELN